MPVSDNDPFLGTWVFDPEFAQYEVGQPPRSGTYVIEAADEQLRFTIDWVAADGTEHHLEILATPDGYEYPYNDPQVADAMIYTRIDEHTLDSAAKKGGTIISYARRVINPADDSMQIDQSGVRPDGTAFTNRSLYRRQY
jgi:hypothetical protein